MSQALFPSMHVSAAGMEAQKRRMDIIAENLANAESTRTSDGGPYRKRQVIFKAVPADQSFQGILHNKVHRSNNGQIRSVAVDRVVEDVDGFREVYDPSHPDADANGMVKLPNVNPVEEMVDMTDAARMFEANATALEASKRMFLKTLELMR